MPEFIIEVANTHGGNKDYINSLIEEFEQFKDHGMKFQPLHPDRIATPDFEWYPVYKKLLFSPKEWNEIIDRAAETKRVWLDLFDTYSVEILENNLSKIYGIKLQVSVLYNQEVIDALKTLNCSGLKCIINISALDMGSIQERIDYFKSQVKPEEVYLEVGFQAYPTKLADSGLNKITELKKHFDEKIVFADHIEGALEDALRLPLIANLYGADIIEKHVLHSTLKTEYDHFSAIDYKKYEALVISCDAYASLSSEPFVNDREKSYLEKSIQIPIARKKLEKGQGLSLQELSYRRSGKKGLSAKEISNLLEDRHILASDVPQGEPLKKENFKQANIATIIAGRLKSSRLKKKALLKIGDLSSVELCIKSCLDFRNTNYTILATSDNEEDRELRNYTYSDNVLFHTGDPEDVIRRYLTVVEEKDIDVIIRVTADMPYVSEEILQILLKSHFQSGADYTAPVNASVGTTPEIFNAKALKEIKDYFPVADYSEYMTWYFRNNEEHFKINLVELPPELVRDYRLTIDYQEDLDLLNKIQNYLDENSLEANLRNIFEYLDQHPEVVAINHHIGLKYKTDQELIDTLNKVTKIPT